NIPIYAAFRCYAVLQACHNGREAIAGTPTNSGSCFIFPAAIRSSCLMERLPVAIVTAHPVHSSAFVATFRSEIEHIVSAHHYLDAASISGVGPEDLARVVFVEGADARPFFANFPPFTEVVVDFSAGDLI